MGGDDSMCGTPHVHRVTPFDKKHHEQEQRPRSELEKERDGSDGYLE